jgi:hypothetical protein
MKLWGAARGARDLVRCPARRRSGARGPPLQRSRLERGAGLRLSEAGLSPHRAARRRAGRNAKGLDDETRTKVEFFTRQYLNAISPANFAFTNPEAIRRAIDTGSISLLSGLANLLADAAAQPGIVQRRAEKEFELGVDIAATPGSVVYQNELMQLIQYAPTTDRSIAARSSTSRPW